MEALAWTAAAAALAAAAFLGYIVIRYVPLIERNAFEIPRHRPPEAYAPPPGISVRPIALSDAEGRTIEGAVISGERPSERVVVFCHETGAGASSWAKHVSFLPEQGYDVVTFAYESGDTFQWPSAREETAVGAVLAWLYRERKGAHVAVFGVSKGACLALSAARHFSVRSAVLDGAFSTRATLESYMRKWVSIYVRPDSAARAVPGWLFGLLSRLALAYGGMRRRGRFFTAEDRAAGLGKPVLFIHAGNDPFASSGDVERLRSLVGGETEVWTAPDAGHSESVCAHPAEYRSRVLSFLDRTLR